jgi:acyl carrier protein
MPRKDKILDFISSELLRGAVDSDVTADEDLLLSGKLDSLGVMSLINYIDRELGQSIPAEDVTIENFISVTALDQYLERLNNA